MYSALPVSQVGTFTIVSAHVLCIAGVPGRYIHHCLCSCTLHCRCPRSVHSPLSLLMYSALPVSQVGTFTIVSAHVLCIAGVPGRYIHHCLGSCTLHCRCPRSVHSPLSRLMYSALPVSQVGTFTIVAAHVLCIAGVPGRYIHHRLGSCTLHCRCPRSVHSPLSRLMYSALPVSQVGTFTIVSAHVLCIAGVPGRYIHHCLCSCTLHCRCPRSVHSPLSLLMYSALPVSQVGTFTIVSAHVLCIAGVPGRYIHHCLGSCTLHCRCPRSVHSPLSRLMYSALPVSQVGTFTIVSAHVLCIAGVPGRYIHHCLGSRTLHCRCPRSVHSPLSRLMYSALPVSQVGTFTIVSAHVLCIAGVPGRYIHHCRGSCTLHCRCPRLVHSPLSRLMYSALPVSQVGTFTIVSAHVLCITGVPGKYIHHCRG